MPVAEPDKPQISMAADVDLVQLERSLLQIGFFGSNDPRYKDSRRRIEMLVNRDGRDVNIAAEFEVAQRIGLPTTTDLDKFLVFLKIAGEQRALYGSIVNPIRFTGGRMLSELRLADSGPNYEAIDAWCQRMKSTTIRSEMAVYLSQSQKYANRSISVFRGYQRIGEKSRTSRTDKFEVIIEDWLIENLNNNFAVIEDLSTYILLTRPIAKGIFGHLLVWFRASNGRKVEKDYTRLCALLNIKAFTQLSRIRDNLGKSLDDQQGRVQDQYVAGRQSFVLLAESHSRPWSEKPTAY